VNKHRRRWRYPKLNLVLNEEQKKEEIIERGAMDTVLFKNGSLVSRTNNLSVFIKNAEIEQIKNNGGGESPAKSFGILLSAYRQRLDFTREDLAQQSQIPVRTIKKIEMGEENVQTVISSIPSIARALRIDCNILINILLSWVL